DGQTSSVATRTLSLTFDGLPELGAGYVYEGWIIVDGAAVSTGRFTVDDAGALTPASFSVPAAQADAAAMFVLSAGLTRTGALRVIGRMFTRIRYTWLFTLSVMVSLATMSAFVNNTAALAVFLPVVLSVAAAKGFSASKVLIPMSYAAQMGGVCTLIGTSTNLLVHALAQDLGLSGFSLFEFAPLGLVTMAVGMVYMMIFGPILLPERRGAELTQTYELGKFITELRGMPDSPLVGQSVADAGLGEKFGVYVIELLRDTEKVWSPRAQKIAVDDILLVRGDWKKINELKTRAKLQLEPEFQLRDAQFEDEGQVLAEVLITPGSRYVGHSLAELRPHWQPGSIVIAIQRRGEVVRDKLRQASLRLGDILLVMTRSDQMSALRSDTNLVVLSEQDEDPASRRGALIAVAIMLCVIGAAFLELMAIVLSALKNDGRASLFIGLTAALQYLAVVVGLMIANEGFASLSPSPIYGSVDVPGQIQRVAVLLIATLITAVIVFRMQRLVMLSGTDTLTGLPNRSYLIHRVPQILADARRDDLTMTLALIDLDHFRRVNDEFGHGVGDRALQHVVHCLRDAIGREQPLIRVG
ncbi:MAG: hypothetical protein CVV17_03980, partial [Gammaproteobacteria bacterium HGW-Gammaproteobacteria-7]